MTNVKTRMTAGKMEFYDPATGNVILTIDCATGKITCGVTAVFFPGQGASTVEGALWYEPSTHVLQYRDNSGTKTVTAS